MSNVFKRGEVWYIRYDLPRGKDGKRKQKMEACPGLSEKEAKQRLREREVARDRGMLVDATRQTLGEYLTEWLQHKRASISPASHKAYEQMIRCHIIPELGGFRLSKLRPIDIQAFYTTLPEKRLDGRGKRLSTKHVAMIHGVLHTALAQAVKLELIYRNPADAVEPPRFASPEVASATEEEITRLLVSIDQSPYRMPILIALATGMRVGEVVGLRWEDYHEQAGLLTVRRSISQVSGEIIVKETKTGKPRPVPIPPSLVAELQTHREWQEGRTAHLGRLWMSDDRWICTRPDGQPFTPNAVTKGFTKLARKIGVGITFHGLRHTQATLALERGVPLKAISERLGHSNPSVTQGIYAHVTPHMQEQAVEVAEYILSLKTPKIRVVGG